MASLKMWPNGTICHFSAVVEHGERLGALDQSLLLRCLGTAFRGIALFDRSAATASVAAARNPLWDASAWLAADALLGIAAVDGEISRIEGAALCLAYLAYLGILIRMSHAVEKLRAESSPIRFLLPIGALAVGFVLVASSADLAVEHGLGLATRYGLDPTAIGLFGFYLAFVLFRLGTFLG
jgi:hypothetical protein